MTCRIQTAWAEARQTLPFLVATWSLLVLVPVTAIALGWHWWLTIPGVLAVGAGLSRLRPARAIVLTEQTLHDTHAQQTWQRAEIEGFSYRREPLRDRPGAPGVWRVFVALAAAGEVELPAACCGNDDAAEEEEARMLVALLDRWHRTGALPRAGRLPSPRVPKERKGEVVRHANARTDAAIDLLLGCVVTGWSVAALMLVGLPAWLAVFVALGCGIRLKFGNRTYLLLTDDALVDVVGGRAAMVIPQSEITDVRIAAGPRVATRPLAIRTEPYWSVQLLLPDGPWLPVSALAREEWHPKRPEPKGVTGVPQPLLTWVGVTSSSTGR